MFMRIVRKVFKKIHFYIHKPGELFRYGSPKLRSVYNSLCKFLFYFPFKKRKDFFRDDISSSIILKDGFLKTSELRDDKLVTNAVNSASVLVDNYLSSNNFQNQQKSYLHTIPFDNDFDLENPIMKLALSDNLVDAATRYLGFLPILSEIRVWYSPNDSNKSEGSQLYHLDYADINQVKVFLPIEDIDENTGPLTFVSASSSKKICDNINYKLTNDEIRVPDKIVKSYITEKDEIQATGAPGDIVFVDTSACLHYGSRGATRPRKILMIQYISPFSFSFPLFYKNKTTFSHLSKNHLNKKEKFLLGSL